MLKSGNQTVGFARNTVHRYRSTSPINIVLLNEKEEAVKLLASNVTDQELRFREDGLLQVQTDDKTLWQLDAVVHNFEETPDPKPHVVILHKEKTMQEELQEFIQQAVANEYGSQSKQMESFEDFMDFDDDEPDGLTSPYELNEELEQEFLASGATMELDPPTDAPTPNQQSSEPATTEEPAPKPE